MNFKRLRLAGLAVAAMLAFSPTMALAAGTAAGTKITNLADLSFAVGGVAQTVIKSNGGVSTDFLVDRKINFNVAAVDTTAVSITPGAGAGSSVLTFKLTNTGNSPQDFAVASTTITAAAAAFGGTDNIDAGPAVTVAVDTNGDGVYTAADTLVFVDELAADAYATVFIVSDAIPSTVVNGDIASYHLLATAHVGGTVNTTTIGALENATAAGAETLAVQDVLFADVQGTDTANDIARDGKHSAQSDFKVASAVVSLTKTALVISDPVNGVTNPQAIPGATVQYTLTIVNAVGASTSATLTTISDLIDANLSVVATASAIGANPIGWSLTDGTNTASGTLLADANTADGLDFGTTVAGKLTYAVATFLTTANAATAAPAGLPARAVSGELQAGETLALTFQVIIN